jgi:hypothetical protein
VTCAVEFTDEPPATSGFWLLPNLNLVSRWECSILRIPGSTLVQDDDRRRSAIAGRRRGTAVPVVGPPHNRSTRPVAGGPRP